MEAQLRSLLFQLSRLVGDDDAGGGHHADPTALSQDVRQVAFGALGASARARCTDLLLASTRPPSLLAFVNRASYPRHAKDKALQKASIECTENVRDYWELYPQLFRSL